MQLAGYRFKRYPFGVKTVDVISLLRKVADGLESGSHILTNVTVSEDAGVDVCGTESVGVTFTQKHGEDNGPEES